MQLQIKQKNAIDTLFEGTALSVQNDRYSELLSASRDFLGQNPQIFAPVDLYSKFL